MKNEWIAVAAPATITDKSKDGHRRALPRTGRFPLSGDFGVEPRIFAVLDFAHFPLAELVCMIPQAPKS